MNLPIKTTLGKTVYDAKPFKESWISDQYWKARRRKGEPDPEMDEKYAPYLYSNGLRVFYIADESANGRGSFVVAEEFNSELPLEHREFDNLRDAVVWLEENILSKMDEVVFHDCPENKDKVQE